MKTTIFLALTLSALSAMADRFVGCWTTVDDETKEKKSVVRVYKHEGRYFGRIIKLFKIRKLYDQIVFASPMVFKYLKYISKEVF